MTATMPEANPNFQFWRGLVADPSGKLLLFSSNPGLIDEVLRTGAASRVVYTGNEEPPGRLAARLEALDAIDGLDLSDRDTVVVDNVTAKQWESIRPLLERLQDGGRRIEVVITGRNRLREPLRGMRDPRATRLGRIAAGLERILRHPVRVFYSRWPIELDGRDEIDLTAGIDPHRAVFVPGDRLKTWRAFLLSRPLFNVMLPGWVLVSRAPGESWIESAFERLARARGIETEKPRISRYVTNETTSIALLCARRGDADYVVRAPASAKGVQLCRRNAETLQRIAQFGFSFRTPEFVGHENSGRDIYVETLIRGKELSLAESPPLWLTRRAFAIADEISRAVRETIAWRALLEQCIERYQHGFDAGYRPQFERLAELLGACLRDYRDTLTVASHGDFKLSNILFRRDLSICGVIDWDCFEERGLPLFDELTCLIFNYSAIDRQHHVIHYLDRVLVPPPDDPHLRLVDERVAKLGFDEVEYLALRILFWFEHALRRYRADDLARPATGRRVIGEPLERAIEQLQRTAAGNRRHG